MSGLRIRIANWVTVVILALPSTVMAQFAFDWHTIDGGGGVSTGGGFVLEGTIGQPDAGVMLIGGAFELQGGFWPGVFDSTDNSLAGDLDFDGDVDLADLALLLSDFGCDAAPCIGDIDGDGVTGISDLAILLANFGS